ncbi:SDR family NAD(P)-dependent oxidoreductase [Paracidobacterium acidisoli]|nr:SDR family NAD(P)-dependent oxidoreductase [Paracidobacterium acidisoli]MBT9331927.1 SDR family NAD(P)-dependent oxidoreductase [Paracidobacterium acidisoli]
MADKVALITGANRGLGFETARQLGQKGVTVVLAARQRGAAEEAAAKLKAEGIDAYGIQLDVTKASDRTAAADWFSRQFGKLDILINNAGIAAVGESDLFKPTVSETPEAELQGVYETNVFSVVLLTHALLPLLKKSPAGRIVNLSSILGSLTLHADPSSPIYSFKKFAYNSSKTALNAWTVHLAWELRDTPIKVTSVHPGWVKTDMGTDAAPMEIPEGAQTSVAAALLAADAPSGRFIHLGEELPW